MTIEQAVKIVAERDGVCFHEKTEHYTCQGGSGFTCLDCGRDTYGLKRPQYATSTDALRPVLAKLTKWERRELFINLGKKWPGNISRNPHEWTFHLLTLNPEQLCLAVAEAIEACKGKEKR